MTKKTHRKSNQNFTLALILGLVALTLTSGYGLYSAKKITLAKLAAPPALSIGGKTMQGYIANQKGLLRFYKKDEDEYGKCANHVDFFAGMHAYYANKDLSLQDWFDKVKPENANEILFAYYNSVNKDKEMGWNLYPRGPYDQKTINTLDKKDLKTFIVPKNTGLIFISKNQGKFCEAKGVIKTEKEFITKFDSQHFENLKDSWILTPTTEKIEPMVNALKKDHMVTSLYNLYQPTADADFKQDQKMDLISLKRPANALSMAWIRLDKKPLNEGEVYVDYPVVTTSAKTGDTVLIPLAKIFESEKEVYSNYWDLDGLYSSFFAAQMIEPGDKESQVKIEGMDIVTEIETNTFIVPNSLIIPIKPNQIAQIGDFILTKYQGDDNILQGWVNAVVLEGSSYTNPKVNYINLLPNETSENYLENGSFQKLHGTIEPGANVIYKKDGVYHMLKVIHALDTKALLVNKEGYLVVKNTVDLQALPIAPKLGTGETILAAREDGTMHEVSVTQWWPKQGKIEAEYMMDGKKEKGVFLYGEVLPLKQQ